MVPLLVSIGVTWLTSMVTQVNTLMDGSHKRIVAILLALIATSSAAFAGYTTYTDAQRKELYRLADVDRALELGEASGGSTDGSGAYVVNDETPAVFRSQLDPDDHRFKSFARLGLSVCESTEASHCRNLTKSDVDDLEGVAVDPRPGHHALYVVGSQSNNKNGARRRQREQLVRLDLNAPTNDRLPVTAQVSPRQALERLLFDGGVANPFVYKRTDDDTAEIEQIHVGMELEGLAMDAAGVLYFGLRAPLCKNGNGAIIVTGNGDEIFANGPDGASLTAHCVSAEFDGHAHSVVSLELDVDTGQVAVLTGSPFPHEAFAPRLCRWSVGESALHDCKALPPLREPLLGKQEALLLPTKSRQVITMIDSDKGLGGQVAYTRKEAGLP